METLSLVVLAAGSSTRFGRPKQLESVGPRGEAILDFTMRDAFDAGCDEVRLVVSPAHEELFKFRYQRDGRIVVLVQPTPRGTAHAAVVGMEHAGGTCMVANGDDLYGATSLKLAAAHAREGSPEEHALVVYELRHTLSPNGPVNRAICSTTEHHLIDAEEVKGLADTGTGSITDEQQRAWSPSALVSMNLWVFRPEFMNTLNQCCEGHDLASITELGLPMAVQSAVARGRQFRILRTPDRWCGLTFPGDAELLRSVLALES